MHCRPIREGISMNTEREFTSRFLESFNKITQPFRSKEILVLINLKAEESLEDIDKREKNLVMLKDLAAKHYNNPIFEDSAKILMTGFEIIITQIRDLKKQVVNIKPANLEEKIHFNSKEFGKGYGLVAGTLTHILQKHS
jgi:HrpA-like RNA helicase